jgi:hypothetical protein
MVQYTTRIDGMQGLAAETAAILGAPHRGHPERAAPNILNNKKVFTVFKSIWSPDPPFFLASGAFCRQWGWVG